jgi:hypothetical protein
MYRFRLPGILTLAVTLAVAAASAQKVGIPVPPTAPDTNTEIEQEMHLKMQHEQQKKRVEQMKRDSQKLLELATELKQYVDKSGENILSLEVIRKADEMEKLARRVKESMRAN